MLLKEIGIDEITRVIGMATAPAFLLGAVAGLLAVLIGRIERLEASFSERPPGAADGISHRRLKLSEAAVTMDIFSGLMTGGMIVMVFAEALVGANYSRLIVITFVLAVNLFMLSLLLLWIELWLASKRRL